jgi:hypothetical protein
VVVQSSDKSLEGDETGGLPDSGYLILEAVRENFVVKVEQGGTRWNKVEQGGLVPASAAGVAVEVQNVVGSLHRVLVLESFKGDYCVTDWIARAFGVLIGKADRT